MDAVGQLELSTLTLVVYGVSFYAVVSKWLNIDTIKEWSRLAGYRLASSSTIFNAHQ